MTVHELTQKQLVEMKNTVENNKLIAEFMGINYEEGGETRYSHESSEYYFVDVELEYHSSWDWLMSVVEKIESLENGIYQVDIVQEGARILKRCKHFDKPIDYTILKMPEGTTKLEATYKAVVQFIEWYNEQS